MVRFFQFALSGFFAGIGGGLYALTYEIVTFDTVAAAMSANALLMTYIGGVGGFAGPIIGAILIVLLQSGVSLLSNAWLVYVGVLFIVMVTFAPGGHRSGSSSCTSRSGAPGVCASWRCPMRGHSRPALLVLLGFVLLVELAPSPPSAPPRARSSRRRPPHRHHGATPWVVAVAALVARRRSGCAARRAASAQRWDALMEGAKIQMAPRCGVKAQEAMS